MVIQQTLRGCRYTVTFVDGTVIRTDDPLSEFAKHHVFGPTSLHVYYHEDYWIIHQDGVYVALIEVN